MPYTAADLFKVETASSFLARGLAFAQSAGLLVTSWRTGDPTKTTFGYLARALAGREGIVSEYIKAGFLESASGDWLTILARETFGVERVLAGYATPTVTIKNNGGGFYPIDANDKTFKATLSGKTYHNISNVGTLTPGQQITLDLTADEPGSDSSAGVNEIDEIVSTMLGVDILSSTAAVGIDEQSDESLKEVCRESRGALSPDGPADAYSYVVKQANLTGVQDITRSSSEGNNAYLQITIYVASASGPVAGPSVTAAQIAVERWATPLCFTPTVYNSVADVIDITATASGDNDLPVGFEATIEAALGVLFAGLPIGKGAGYNIDPTTITTTIRNAVPQITSLPTYLPSTPVHVAAGHVPVLGVVSVTEV